jgi:rare lipoprotein A
MRIGRIGAQLTFGLLTGLLVGLLTGCGGTAPGFRTAPGSGEEGLASYYHDSLQGNRTANGEIFDQNAWTAAHRTLPFGTKVRVTRLSNGKSIVVRINDRGPFVAGRIIDLSRRGAQELGFLRDGVVRVRVEVVEAGR